jgi:hypothetical protein
VRGVNRSAVAVLSALAVLAGVLAGTALATTGPAPYAVVNVRLTDKQITLSTKGVHDVNTSTSSSGTSASSRTTSASAAWRRKP